jgi:hypothetical protein
MTYEQMIDRCWDRAAGQSREGWLGDLPLAERFAMHWELYRGQVLNGGHLQWHDNGYAELGAQTVLQVLKELKTLEAEKMLTFLPRAMELLEEVSGWDAVSYDEDVEEGTVQEELSQLDREFYTVDELLQAQVEAWWLKTFRPVAA